MGPSSVEEMHSKYPLGRFSVYSQIQADVVRDLSHEVIHLLDASVTEREGNVEVSNVNQVYGKFWLLVLGGYELVRTMDEASACFSERLAKELPVFKRRLNVVRIPFAKQEIAGSGKPIGDENSISRIDMRSKDLCFSIGGEEISMRRFTLDLIAFLDGIRPDDVKDDLRTAQAAQAALPRAQRRHPEAKNNGKP